MLWYLHQPLSCEVLAIFKVNKNTFKRIIFQLGLEVFHVLLLRHLLKNTYDPYGRLRTLHLCHARRYHRLARMSSAPSIRRVKVPCCIQVEKRRKVISRTYCICMCVYTLHYIVTINIIELVTASRHNFGFWCVLNGPSFNLRWLDGGEKDGKKRIGVYFVFGLDTPKDTWGGKGMERTQGNSVVNNNLRIIYAFSDSGTAVLGCYGDERGTIVWLR